MPFLTEQIWQALGEVAPIRGLSKSGTPASPSVMIAAWPNIQPSWQDLDVEARMGRLQNVIRAIRNIRSDRNVDEKARVSAHVRCASGFAAELDAARPFIEQLASVDSLVVGPEVVKPADAASAVGTDWELYVPLTGLIDRPAEIERKRKQRQTLVAQFKSHQAKLNNADFMSKAPRDVVELHQQRAAELQAQIASIEEILRELGGEA
jgi:valyl-tRNA synthetase